MRGSISIERVVAFIYNIYHLEQPVGMFDTRYGRLRLAHDFGYGPLPDFFRPSIIGARLCFSGSDSVVDLVRKRQALYKLQEDVPPTKPTGYSNSV